MEYVIIIFRTFMLYILIVFIFRAMGKREIGELSILDLVIFMMIAEMAVIAIEDPKLPFLHAMIPMIVLTITQIALAHFSLVSQTFRRKLEGEPTIIIHKGQVDVTAMKKTRYNFDDLLLQLREEQIGDIRHVEYAVLEISGKLTVFPKNSPTPLAFPLIMDGEIQENQLRKINKTSDWLEKQLHKQGYNHTKDILYCSYLENKFFVAEKKRE